MEPHPRIELGFQVYETCTSPFMFMRQKLACAIHLPALCGSPSSGRHKLSKIDKLEGIEPSFTRYRMRANITP